MTRFRRLTALFFVVFVGAVGYAFGQPSQLVFTVAAPDQTVSQTSSQASAVVGERGLALWSGAKSDFGIGVALSDGRWTVRSVASMTALPLGGHNRPTFQQVEITRPLFWVGSMSVAGGGGVREEWN